MTEKNGGRHCHGSNTKPQAVRRSNGTIYYPNCTAARSTGAAPVRRGQPGYGTHLDRDRDGIGCE
ncbi:excalibur calcium-binding domain-containing protein [Parasphingorhabdus sp. JC815]|uniref:excalibur calcium-binding domain-containing protein n=1 Tax=Parasphingorhabdus sp. JC815 TaxID=3232140 RepID=UPI003459CEBD